MKVEYALNIEVTNLHDTIRIQARAFRLTDPDNDYGYRETDLPLKDLVSQAWIDANRGYIFGMSTEYHEVHSIELDRAEAMVKMLRKIKRGMEKIDASEGYVKEGDFATYLFRVARVLGIKKFRVRSTREQRLRPGGEYWRDAIPSGVQYYIQAVCEAVEKGELYSYTN